MKGPSFSLKKIEQEIDLAEFYDDVDFSGHRGLKESIAQAIIDRIVERTESGEGMKIAKNGAGSPVKLNNPVYSDPYAKSLEFKAAGKKKSKVNMTLTGDMLASVDVVSTSGSTIRIGITDDEQVPKAFNHNTGDTVPERPWFGISKGELKEILSSFSGEIKSLKRKDLAPDDKRSERTRIKAMDFLDDAFSDDE